MGEWRSLLPDADAEIDLETLVERVALLEAQVASLGGAWGLGDDRLAQRALALHRARRRRTTEFDADLFGEPAWDMLLDLFVNKVRHKLVPTESLCIASGIPHTTALRWIRVLEQRELLARAPAHYDGRVVLVDLTQKGFALMRNALARFVLPRAGKPVVDGG